MPGTFRFLHVADVHLDSPMRGLTRYEGLPVAEIRGATRAAFTNMVEAALAESVDFVVIAGDLFDGDWRDMSTGLHFAAAIGRLTQRGIPVFILAGNHDADSRLTSQLPLPKEVRRFGARKAESFTLPELGVVLHGRSFATPEVREDMTPGYPAAVAGLFNIGVLHTSLAGYAAHETYAPCAPATLAAKGYDYWALGHVHEHQVVQAAPHIVFPGNLQGRHIRETGAKGAVLVEVEDGVVRQLRHLPLDVLRWCRVELPCDTLADEDALLDAMRAALHGLAEAEGEGRLVVARLVLTGATPLHGRLQDRRGALRDQVRALAAHASERLFIEKLSLHTTPPRSEASAQPIAEDLAAMLREALADPELAQALQQDLAGFLAVAPEARDEQRESLLAQARAGEWTAALAAASEALEARLMQGAG